MHNMEYNCVHIYNIHMVSSASYIFPWFAILVLYSSLNIFFFISMHLLFMVYWNLFSCLILQSNKEHENIMYMFKNIHDLLLSGQFYSLLIEIIKNHCIEWDYRQELYGILFDYFVNFIC